MSGDAAAPTGGAAAAASAASARQNPAKRSLAWTSPLELAAAPKQLAAAAEAAAEKAGEKLAAVQERGLGIATRAWNAVSGNGPEALHGVELRQDTALCSPDDLHLPAVEVRGVQRVAHIGAARAVALQCAALGRGCGALTRLRATAARRRRWWRCTRARQPARSGCAAR
jgi:hypothetical protein